MNAVRKLAKSHKTWGLLNKAVYNGSAFVITILLSKILPKEEFGLFALAMSLFLMFCIIESFFQTATVKYCATTDSGKLETIISNLLYLKMISIVIFCALLFGLRPMLLTVYKGVNLDQILALFPLIFVFYTLHSHFSAVLRAQRRLKELLANHLIFSVLYIGLSLALIDSIQTARQIFLIFLCAHIGSVFFMIFRYPRLIQLRWGLDRPVIKELIDYGKYSVMIGIGGVIYQNMDMLMIGWMTSIDDVGVYKIGKISATFVLTITSGLLLTMLPEISSLDEQKKYNQIKSLYQRNIRILLYIFVPFFLMSLFFAKPAYTFFFHDKYAGASMVFIIFAATGVVRAVANPQGIILAGVGLIKFDSLQMIISLVANIALNLILIPQFKAAGAACATISALLIGAVLKEYFLRTRYFLKRNASIQSLKGVHYET